jgi:hypothetical protein
MVEPVVEEIPVGVRWSIADGEVEGHKCSIATSADGMWLQFRFEDIPYNQKTRKPGDHVMETVVSYDYGELMEAAYLAVKDRMVK